MSDRYRLKHLFAQGGMAEVYLGVAVGEAGFEKPVAIKRVLPQLAQDPRVSDMFMSEAKLAKFLSHQNVVQVLDVGRSDDGVYMVMELVNGWDLETLLELAQKRGVRFPPALAAFIASQTLAGLSHAYRRTHEGKPVLSAHRDVSGSNILISTEGEVKVTDFGIARVEGLGNKKTEPGTFKGKIAYAAPEILRTEPANHLSDQFALGVVLFKLLCGRSPFTGEDQWATYYAALQDQTPQVDATVPRPLAQIVLRMLEKAAAKRF
ncbi:MAG: serine/threonine protein kinase [Myxococcaceae bacterium]